MELKEKEFERDVKMEQAVSKGAWSVLVVLMAFQAEIIALVVILVLYG